MIIWYLLISILYCATFVAFMKTKKDDESETYMDAYGEWNGQYLILCIVGTFFWPLVIPFMVFYKVAFKILNKNK